ANRNHIRIFFRSDVEVDGLLKRWMSFRELRLALEHDAFFSAPRIPQRRTYHGIAREEIRLLEHRVRDEEACKRNPFDAAITRRPIRLVDERDDFLFEHSQKLRRTTDQRRRAQ